VDFPTLGTVLTVDIHFDGDASRPIQSRSHIATKVVTTHVRLS
jgi:hypothetical protein